LKNIYSIILGVLKNVLVFLKKLDFKSLLIIVLILIILFIKGCGGNHPPISKKIIKIDGKKYSVLKHTIDTTYISKNTVIYRKGKDITIEKEIPIYIPLNIDTSAIIKDYYTSRLYKDTLTLDSLSFVVINDTIAKNKIESRKFSSHIVYPVIKETTIVKELPKNQLFLGATLGFDKTNIVNFAGPSFIFKSKKDYLYSFGIGYSNAKTVSIQGGMLFKIKLKK